MDLAVGFQAGIAQTGKMCGCLSGIIMATGLIIPREELGLVAWKQEVSDVSREIMSLFIKEFGSLNCSDIAGCDMGDEVNRKHFLIELQGRQRICEPIVGKSVDIAIAFLKTKQHENGYNQTK
jgi:C_GCAxxG_C_C family probable redox protein